MESDIERLFSAVWENNIFKNDLPVGIYAISKDGGLVICNQRVREILNLPEGDLSHQILVRDTPHNVHSSAEQSAVLYYLQSGKSSKF